MSLYVESTPKQPVADIKRKHSIINYAAKVSKLLLELFTLKSYNYKPLELC